MTLGRRCRSCRIGSNALKAQRIRTVALHGVSESRNNSAAGRKQIRPPRHLPIASSAPAKHSRLRLPAISRVQICRALIYNPHHPDGREFGNTPLLNCAGSSLAGRDDSEPRLAQPDATITRGATHGDHFSRARMVAASRMWKLPKRVESNKSRPWLVQKGNLGQGLPWFSLRTLQNGDSIRWISCGRQGSRMGFRRLRLPSDPRRSGTQEQKGRSHLNRDPAAGFARDDPELPSGSRGWPHGAPTVP